MRYYVLDRENAKFFEKHDGSRVWHLSRADAMKVSENAIVVALDERNLNDSLNAYFNREFFKQIHYDQHLGWVS